MYQCLLDTPNLALCLWVTNTTYSAKVMGVGFWHQRDKRHIDFQLHDSQKWTRPNHRNLSKNTIKKLREFQPSLKFSTVVEILNRGWKLRSFYPFLSHHFDTNSSTRKGKHRHGIFPLSRLKYWAKASMFALLRARTDFSAPSFTENFNQRINQRWNFQRWLKFSTLVEIFGDSMRILRFPLGNVSVIPNAKYISRQHRLSWN